MSECPLQPRSRIPFDQQHLRFAPLHADLVGSVDRLVERSLLTGEHIECNSMQRHRPFQATAENMEIVSGLIHPGALSHIFDQLIGRAIVLPPTAYSQVI